MTSYQPFSLKHIIASWAWEKKTMTTCLRRRFHYFKDLRVDVFFTRLEVVHTVVTVKNEILLIFWESDITI